VIANNVIVSNLALASLATGLNVKGGGALNAQSSGPTLRNNFIAHNVVTNAGSFVGFGGGLCLFTSPGPQYVVPSIVNNTFVQNRALNGTGAENGGAFYFKSINPVLVNNLIAFNSSGTLAASAAPIFRNNCAFGNAAFNYQGVTDPTGANGNLSADPLLANAAADFHLAANSPCIDAGDDSEASAGTVDLDGQLALSGPHVDIGADEVASSQTAVVLSITNRTSSQFVIHVDGSFGSQHILQRTLEFSAWTPVWTNQTLPFDYTVQTSNSFAGQFYRVVTLP
jgi:hypothetical protein